MRTGLGFLTGTAAGNAPQVQQFFNRLAMLPSPTDQTTYATFINALVPDGTWGALDALVIAAAPDSGTSLTELTSGTFAPTVDNLSLQPTFTSYQGWSNFAATTQADINANFNPSTAGGHYTQNAATIAAWNLYAPEIRISLWEDQSDTDIECWPYYSDGKIYTQANDGTEVGAVNGADGSGWFSVNRTASNLYTVKRNNSLLATQTTVSRALVNSSIYFGHGTGGNSLILAAYAIGALTSSQETTLYNALNTLFQTSPWAIT